MERNQQLPGRETPKLTGNCWRALAEPPGFGTAPGRKPLQSIYRQEPGKQDLTFKKSHSPPRAMGIPRYCFLDNEGLKGMPSCPRDAKRKLLSVCQASP